MIRIYNVIPEDGSTSVEYGKSLPLPNSMKGASFAEPYHIKVVPRRDGRVLFWQTI